MSHLLQMRGLKQKVDRAHGLFLVASFTDAWIETIVPKRAVPPLVSHLLQMRGLKHDTSLRSLRSLPSHLLQMRGLKHK